MVGEKSFVLVQLVDVTGDAVFLVGFHIARMLRTYSNKTEAEEALLLVRDATAGQIPFDVIAVPHIER